MQKNYTISIALDLGLIEIRFQEKIEAKDVIACLTELYGMEDFDPTIPMIFDFRDCRGIANYKELVRVIK